MAFVRDTWYCAGWSDDLGPTDLTPRLILNEPVLLYRREDGTAVAIGNRCPHRFAPLHLGRHDGDNVVCPYHGLAFGPSGACVHNPHGDGTIPKAAKVPQYPLVERHDTLWIWMGDAAKADADLIPDFGETARRPGWGRVRGTLEVPVPYELVADNLLDLSHVPYLHPFLTPKGPMPEGFREVRELKQDGDTVWSMHCLLNSPITPLFQLLWEDAPALIEGYFDMRWTPPSNLLLRVGVASMGAGREDGVKTPMAHLLTPATPTSTHYFWCQARDRKTDDAMLDEQLKAGIDKTFRDEDESMLGHCYKLMGTADLMSLKPVLLPGDAPALRARRILGARLEAEHPPT